MYQKYSVCISNKQQYEINSQIYEGLTVARFELLKVL